MSRLGLKLLLVEDDEGIRDSLVAILEGEGYDVVAADSAERGLEHLMNQRFDLVITDYALPGKTGTWLLHESGTRGRLTQGVMITAFEEVPHVDGVQVFRKPLDLDYFLKKVDELLHPARDGVLDRIQRELTTLMQSSPREGRDMRIEFVLYISSSSPSSLKAMRNVQQILEGYDVGQVQLTVCDLSRGYPRMAEEDRIAFTPTLVKRSPEPRTWIVGHLENGEIINDLLRDAGVERKKTA